MRLIDQRYQVRGVAERWKAQYSKADGTWGYTISGDTRTIYEKLVALDPETATAKEVAAIIGNTSWAGPGDCNECGESFDALVEVGQEPDYESATARLCGGCLRKAAALIQPESEDAGNG